MSHSDNKGFSLIRTALLGLLILAQSAAFAHELDHFDQPDVGQCAVCPIAQELDHALSESQPAPETTPALNVATGDPVSLAATRQITCHRARAPPIHS